MNGVQQSGTITPFHLAQFVAPGVIADAGATIAGQRVLASLRGADFNTASDQPITIPQNFVAFQLTGIIATNAALTPLSTAVGGFYPQASKGGVPLVAAAQNYLALSTAASLLNCTLTAFAQGTRFSSVNLGTIGGLLNIWLSLTTPQGSPAVADVYVLGIDLS